MKREAHERVTKAAAHEHELNTGATQLRERFDDTRSKRIDIGA